jgi:uroporphyrinogen-III synthase
MLTLLLTRPEAQSRAFAAALEAACPGRFRMVIAPLLEIVPRKEAIDTGGIAALAFTSANAVAAYAAAGADRRLPAYCVGEATADAARALGLAARAAEGDAARLAALIARDAPGPVLHPRGVHAAADLAGMLREAGIACRDVVAYDQRARPVTPEADALGRGGGIDILTAFSPRSGRLLAAAARCWDLRKTRILSISAAADAALGDLAAARRIIAETPSRASMIAALARLAG